MIVEHRRRVEVGFGRLQQNPLPISPTLRRDFSQVLVPPDKVLIAGRRSENFRRASFGAAPGIFFAPRRIGAARRGVVCHVAAG